MTLKDSGLDHFADVESDQSTDVESTQKHEKPFERITDAYRIRTDHLRAEGKLTLQLMAIIRRRMQADPVHAAHFSHDAETGKPVLSKDGKKIAQKIFTELVKNPDDAVSSIVEALKTLRGSMKKQCGKVFYEHKLGRAVRDLAIPALDQLVESTPGLNYVSLGQLISECIGEKNLLDAVRDGRLTAREQESRIWKRLGVGLVDVRDGEGPKRQRKCVDPLLAQAHGYNPERRAVLFVIGTCLIMNGKSKGSRYYAIYEARREFERAKEGATKKAAHMRAKRYTEKKFVRHFLAAYNAPR